MPLWLPGPNLDFCNMRDNKVYIMNLNFDNVLDGIYGLGYDFDF
jgi:hypothetical protein